MIKLKKSQRKVKNLLLQPFLQIKLGLYSILLTIALVAGLSWTLYVKLGQFADIVMQLTDVQEEVSRLLSVYVAETWLLVGIILGVFLIVSISISIVFTHRMIGPTIAFRRHIRTLAAGDSSIRTNLRKGDAFQEVAEELNLLSEVLAKKKTQ